MYRNLKLFSVVAVLAVGSIVASACSPSAFVGSVAPLFTASTPTGSVATVPASGATQGLVTTSSTTLDAYQQVMEQIYAQVSPSVVTINVNQSAQTLSGGSQPALGSGFVWDTQGHIVTNNHVVDGAQDIQVTFSDGTTLPATVVGTDPNTDLAVIQVSAPAGLLHPVRMGDSSKVVVGQVAIAIGNPFGEQDTMTVGIISGLGRNLPVQTNSFQGASYSIPDVIQTDAPINPGNSGGVLLDENGYVIGVTSAIESNTQSSSGIGFAIPSNIVNEVVPALIRTGQHQTPYLGISGATLVSQLAQAMGLNPNTQGALVEEVVPGGPAAKAGLQGSSQSITLDGQDVSVGGDVITAINGTAIHSMDDLVAYVASSTEVGQTVTLSILRDGKPMQLSLTLGVRPSA
ncbi:MAG: trypsin-like peptidase domain-containing protein [Anaerolineales bacterium]|jgi:2-alkenal reductase